MTNGQAEATYYGVYAVVPRLASRQWERYPLPMGFYPNPMEERVCLIALRNQEAVTPQLTKAMRSNHPICLLVTTSLVPAHNAGKLKDQELITALGEHLASCPCCAVSYLSPKQAEWLDSGRYRQEATRMAALLFNLVLLGDDRARLILRSWLGQPTAEEGGRVGLLSTIESLSSVDFPEISEEIEALRTALSNNLYPSDEASYREDGKRALWAYADFINEVLQIDIEFK